jgi:siroheme synthase (precorrin-2 oxidase/ferrochelatase)
MKSYANPVVVIGEGLTALRTIRTLGSEESTYILFWKEEMLPTIANIARKAFQQEG